LIFETVQEFNEFLVGKNLAPLQRIKKEVLSEKEIGEVREEVKKVEKQIDYLMVDWGIKLVPSKLLEFCYSLLEGEEITQVERKCVEAILQLIRKMYCK